MASPERAAAPTPTAAPVQTRPASGPQSWLLVPVLAVALVAAFPQAGPLVEGLLLLWTLLGCIVAHELGHGFAARDNGDTTALEQGRLSTSPWPHLEPVGSVLVPVLSSAAGALFGAGVVVGWARPLPLDASRLKDPKVAALRVALAGPLVNLVLGVLSSLALIFLLLALHRIHPEAVAQLASLPVEWVASPVLETGYPFFFVALTIARWSLLLNAFLVGVNLLPLPPLDGGKALRLLVRRPLRTRLERAQAWLLGIALLLLPTGAPALLLWPVAWLWLAGIRAVGIVTGVPVP